MLQRSRSRDEREPKRRASLQWATRRPTSKTKGGNMPEKTQAERAKRAKRRGTSIMVKDSDLERVGLRSMHGAKRPSGAVEKADFSDRSTSVKRSPGQGK